MQKLFQLRTRIEYLRKKLEWSIQHEGYESYYEKSLVLDKMIEEYLDETECLNEK